MSQHFMVGFAREEVEQFAASRLMNIKFDDEYNLVLLDYSQIDTPKNDHHTWDCRGIIYDHGTGQVVCRTMPRFFNLGEMGDLHQNFRWDGFTAFEKVDGSMIKVWYHPQRAQWFIATRGTMYAESECWNTLVPDAGKITFRDLFLRTLNIYDDEQWDAWSKSTLDVGFTYIFELCCSENRVVTRYANDRIYDICAICNDTGMTMFSTKRKEFAEVGILEVPQHSITSREHIQEQANALKDLVEGFVLWDGHMRIKVKSATYVAVHHMRGEGGMSPKRAMDIVLKGEVDEVVAYFPEWEEYLRTWEAKWRDVHDSAIAAWESVKDIESQKDFALAIQHLAGKSALFTKRKNPEMSFEQIFGDMRDSHCYNLVGAK